METNTELNRKKKLLFLSSRVPYPLVGGDKIRVFNALTILSQKYEIDLLYIDNQPIKESTQKVLSQVCSKINCFIISKKQHYFKTIKGFLTNTKPLQVNYYYDLEIQNWINNHINDYDAVFCNLIRTTEYVRQFSLPKYVDFVDSIAMNYEKAYQKATGLWKIIYAIEKQRVKRYEKEIAEKFNKKIIISEVDKSYIDKENRFDIQVIGNFVTDIPIDSQIKIKNNQLSFLGKMDYEPNVSAVTYFAYKILPLIKEKRPNIIFKIIGANPIKKVKELSKIEGIEVTGFVENPYILLQESALLVAPMISGAGVQNKILEAMKIGKCVITTPIGAEGLDNLTGKELIVCNNEQEMADKIIYFLSNQEEIFKIGQLAIKYIEKNYSKEKISSKLFNFL